MPRDPLLVVILGPTGSGKTSLSLQLAERFQGEIVNCDSVAMYREFRIGTAKPTPEELACAPHHLFDVIEPSGYTTAGEYARMAREVIQDIGKRESLPIVTGGTGLYLKALLQGLFPGPGRSEELRQRLRSRMQNRGPKYLHRVLAKLDPQAAESIHANDIPKSIRAIEASLSARLPMSEQWKRGRNPLHGFTILRIGLDPGRAQLYDRINRRVLKMFEAGLVDEARLLMEKYGEGARPFGAIGYKQVVELLNGQINSEAAVFAVQQAHRNYAKRQMTWFRREPNVKWLAGFGDQADLIEKSIGLVEEQR